jgi:hypothetical protein
VPTPESYREQFVSDGDLRDQELNYPLDEVTIEQESPKSGQKTTTYKPYRPDTSPIPEDREAAPSTQFIRDRDDSTWDSVADAASKKSSKKEQKKTKAAAAAAALTSAAMLSREEQDERDYRPETASYLSNPFSDTYAAPSTIAPSVISSAPSASSAQTAYYQPESSGSVASFAPSYYEPDASPSMVSFAPSSSSVQTAYYQPEEDYTMRRPSEQRPNGHGFIEGEVNSDSAPMHVPGSFDETPVAEKTLEEAWEPSPKKETKGKKKVKDTDQNLATEDVPRRVEPEPETKASKKEKKKKKSKRASVDTWEMSDVSPPSSPTIDRDIRDIEPSQSSAPSRDYISSKKTPNDEESNSSKAANAAMAGGFAALVGAAMNQDQDRMASDLERARRDLESAEKRGTSHESTSPHDSTRALHESEKNVTIPSYAFEDIDELADKTPKRKKEKRHSSGKWSPTVGSPLRTEMKYEDYMGAQAGPSSQHQQPFVEAPKVPTSSPFTTAPEQSTSRNVYDSGYYGPDDYPRNERPERESDSFFSRGPDEGEKTKVSESNAPGDYDSNAQNRSDDEDMIMPGYDIDDDDMKSMLSLSAKYDDPDREERRRRRREAREARSASRGKSRDRGYNMDDGGERKRRHRRHKTDERSDEDDTKSTISEGRSEYGERRRRHKRREGDKERSPESKTRSRSTAASDLGDPYDERRSSRRRSIRDDDDVSLISSFVFDEEDRSPKKEEEKSSKSKDHDDEERKHRRRKHRSDRGSTYGSDDDDARSTVSSSSRREKRSSRSEKGHGERRGSDEKVHRSSYVR